MRPLHRHPSRRFQATIAVLALLLGAIAVFARSAFARQDETAPADDGAAQQQPAPEQPGRWILRARDRSKEIRLSDEEWMALSDFEVDLSLGPTPEVRTNILRFTPVVERVRRGSLRSPPPEPALVPGGQEQPTEHLAAARKLVWIISHDWQLRLYDQDNASAAERLATLYRLANHVSSDRTLTSAAVACAIFAAAEQRSDLSLDHAAISPAEAASLVRALKTIDAADPFHFMPGVARDRERGVRWMISAFSGDGGLDKLRESPPALWGEPVADGAALASLTQTQLEQRLRACDEAWGKMIAAFRNEDEGEAAAALAAIRADEAAGMFEPFASALIDAPLRFHENWEKSRAALVRRLAQLQSIADGTLDPDSLANAAVWYMRAADSLQGLNAAKADAIRAYARQHDRAADPSLLEILTSDQVQEVVKLLRRASTLEKCDFGYMVSAFTPPLVRRYHPGMRDLTDLLAADAARLLHQAREGSPAAAAGAAERLAMGYKLAARLGRDDSIMSALTAQADLRDIDSLAAAAFDSHAFDESQAATIRAAAASFRKGDPLGFERGMVEARKTAEGWLEVAAERHRQAELESDRSPRRLDGRSREQLEARLREDQEKAQKYAKSLGDDDVLWLLAVFTAESPRDSAPLLDRMKLLDGVIDVAAWDDALAVASAVRPLYEQGRFDELAALEHKTLADVTTLARRSRNDVHAALERVKAAR